jgi:hypothetical protein
MPATLRLASCPDSSLNTKTPQTQRRYCTTETRIPHGIHKSGLRGPETSLVVPVFSVPWICRVIDVRVLDDSEVFMNVVIGGGGMPG